MERLKLSFILIYIIGAFIYTAQVSNLSTTESVAVPQVAAAVDDKLVNSSTDYSTDSPLINLINDTRVEYGKEVLVEKTILNEVAEHRASDMITRGYYSHTDPDNTDYVKLLNKLSVNPDYSCENLDLLFDNNINVVVDDWLQSPEHRNCLLNGNLTSVGVAYIKSGEIAVGSEIKNSYIAVAIFSTN